MPNWIPEEAILAIHLELLAEHGGTAGRVDNGSLESTLARPQQRLAYSRDNEPGLSALAASYGYGFAKNHCFTDGNKRIALVAIDVFLQINGFELVASEEDAFRIIDSLATGGLSEDELTEWISNNIQEYAE